MDFDKACDILNLPPIFDYNELKKNYHIMALKYHPDKNNNSEESTVIFQSINDAYNYLYNYLIDNDTKYNKYDYHFYNASTNSYIDLINNFLSSLNDIYSNNTETHNIPNIPNIDIIQMLKNGCKNFSFKLIEDLNKVTVLKLYEYIYLYHDILNISEESINKIEEIVRKKLENDSIIILNPSLKNLLDNDIYKLTYEDETLYIPLWHNDLIYDISGVSISKSLNIKCIANIPNNYSIDSYNHIHIKIHENIRNIFDKKKIQINIDSKVFEIATEKLLIKNYQTFTFYNCGIPKINENDILDISKKSHIYIHIYLS